MGVHGARGEGRGKGLEYDAFFFLILGVCEGEKSTYYFIERKEFEYFKHKTS